MRTLQLLHFSPFILIWSTGRKAAERYLTALLLIWSTVCSSILFYIGTRGLQCNNIHLAQVADRKAVPAWTPLESPMYAESKCNWCVGTQVNLHCHLYTQMVLMCLIMILCSLHPLVNILPTLLTTDQACKRQCVYVHELQFYFCNMMWICKLCTVYHAVVCVCSCVLSLFVCVYIWCYY